ncbi:MAG: hypothetical protein LBD30_01405 [Verrucomicrobiales bacterium]|jgi:hypothetical protein|nr:hypothetical protein [Verrucomicrobiales bacterium]
MSISNKLARTWVLGGLLALASSSAQEVYLINATSVPAISVTIDGRPFYPFFPQGLYTGGSATDRAAVVYQIKDLRGEKERSLTMNYQPRSRQALVIHGDFTPSADKNSRRHAAFPNVKLFPLDLTPPKDEPRLRYHLVNLIPNQTLRLLANPEPIDIPCGQILTLSGQKPLVTLTVQVADRHLPVLIHQRRVLRDCHLIFYETGAGASFIRFFTPIPAAGDEPEEE